MHCVTEGNPADADTSTLERQTTHSNSLARCVRSEKPTGCFTTGLDVVQRTTAEG